MRNSIFAIALALIIALTLTGCNSKNESANSKTGEIVLEISGGIPYEWAYTIADSSIVKFKDLKEEASDAIGGNNKEHYTFVGVNEGKTTITFELKSITDKSVEETKVYDVEVDKKSNITITERK